jgi:hypothetical protein
MRGEVEVPRPAARSPRPYDEELVAMDVVTDLLKAALALAGFFILLVLIPILFMFIFSIATSIDERLER